MKLIDTLINNGFSVQVRHDRYGIHTDEDGQEYIFECPARELRNGGITILPHGGTTTVSIRKDGDEFYGVSYCNETDNFNREVGVNMAIKRALAVRQAVNLRQRRMGWLQDSIFN